MLKKLLKAVTAFTLLLGCYFVYFHAFAVIVEQLRANRRFDGTMFPAHDSDSKLEAIAHARSAFGSEHWSAAKDLEYRYYNAERGFWMYAKQVWRIVEENGVKYNGKRIRMAPFALITISRDGKNTKTVVSDEAIFDLNEPLSLNASSEAGPLKIKHAWIERNVVIRDDRSTPHDPTDDMRVLKLTAIEYDEPTQKIESSSDVLIQDKDITISGTELEIKLRSMDPVPGQFSGGFQGAEHAILKRNVHVVMRDVGKSGILPGKSQASQGKPKESKVQVQHAGGKDTKPDKLASADEPTPLDITCDGLMRVDMPEPPVQVAVGPPEPPAPTLVRFERNVVALRGAVDDRPDQLTCDTLKLSLVPADKPPRPPAATVSQGENPSQVLSAKSARQAPNVNKSEPQGKPQDAIADAKSSDQGKNADEGAKGPESAPSEEGAFGNMTLQRAHATGHVVWLYLPRQGMKLRMNELLHVRQVATTRSQTYCRGDVTRPFELDKVDMIQDPDDPNYGEVTKVTHIRAIDATLYDDGSGLDTGNVLARGPGRLETRPDRDQPLEHVAIWQKDLIVQNLVGPDGKVAEKKITLTGKRPCFIDETQKSSLDSAQVIIVWLKPKPQVAAKPSTATTAAMTPGDHASTPSVADHGGGSSKPADAGFQVDKLYASNDVHMHAPNKDFTARERLDAEFDQPPASSAAASTEANEKQASDSQSAKPEERQNDGSGAAGNQDGGTNQMTPTDTKPAEETKSEPPMTGSADRIWLRVAVKPEAASQQESGNGTKKKQTDAAGASASTTGALGSNAEVRKIWMFGSVALHQDPAEGKVKGNNASGEAAYIENRGKGMALAYLYDRDPTEKPPRPGPLPLARVETDDRELRGEDIKVNQATDQAWVFGPGTSTQLTARGLLTDKAPEEEEEDVTSQDSLDASNNLTGTKGAPPAEGNRSGATDVAGTNLTQRSTAHPSDSAKNSTSAKPKTRGGVPLTEKVPLTITWTKKMEFMGRSTDLEGNPAGKAIFYGNVVAVMEDGQIQCNDHMITYADRIVPLTQLGSVSGKKQRDGAAGADDDSEPEPKPDLAVIECFGKAVAVSRKVHPDQPVELQRQIVKGDYLNYDRRSGEFYVPGEGLVYLYDRPKKSSEDNASGSSGPDDPGAHRPATTRRTVTPTSGRAVSPSSGRSSRRSAGAPSAASRTDDNADEEIPPLVLTKIKFVTGMRGRFGTGKENDKTENRWAEFFGDVEAARAEVPTVDTGLNFDRLPSDGFSLTGQTLRVITEPPPVGAPPSTPARNYLKVWDKAYARDATSIVQADVITYDSYKDLIYAYGEQGREVLIAQQYAPMQPVTRSTARAWQFNPKTHASYAVDNNTLTMVDRKTGVRPTAAKALDPNKKPPKKKKQQFRLTPNNIERRGFTGQ